MMELLEYLICITFKIFLSIVENQYVQYQYAQELLKVCDIYLIMVLHLVLHIYI